LKIFKINLPLKKKKKKIQKAPSFLLVDSIFYELRRSIREESYKQRFFNSVYVCVFGIILGPFFFFFFEGSNLLFKELFLFKGKELLNLVIAIDLQR